MLPMYDLTAMTGKEAAEQRTVVIGIVELNWRLWIIFIASLPLSLIVGAIAWVFIGSLAIFTVPIVMGVSAWLFYMRSGDGMKLRNYQTLWDRKSSQAVGKFIMCGEFVETSLSQFRRGMSYCVAVEGGPVGPMPVFDDDPDDPTYHPEAAVVETARPDVFDAFADSGVDEVRRDAIRAGASS